MRKDAKITANLIIEKRFFMMDSMFGLIIGELFKADKSSVIEYIRSSLEEGEINLEQTILFENKNITIKDFLRKQKSPEDSEGIESLITKYNLKGKNDRMEAYYALSNVLYDISREEGISLDKVKEKVEGFLLRKIDPKLISDYINTYYATPPKRDFASKDFLLSILNHPHSVYLFEEIVIKYLGFEKIKGALDKDILIQGYLYCTINIFNVVRKYDFLKEIDLNGGDNLYKHICLLKFDELVDKNLLNEMEQKEIVDHYFKTKVEVSEPSVSDNDGVLIYQKENWFSVKSGQEDLISILASTSHVVNGQRGFLSCSTNLIEIILQALKNKKKSQPLSNYILSREENLLVEYLVNGSAYFRKKHYDNLVKKFPALLQRQSSHGLLDTLMSRENFILYLEKKTIALYKELPVNILLGSDTKRILELAYCMPGIKGNLKDFYFGEKINFYSDVLELVVNATNNFPDADENIKKAHDLFVVHQKIVDFMIKNDVYYAISSEKINQQIAEILNDKDNGLNEYEEYQKFGLIEVLISMNKLNKDYMKFKYLEKEKVMLLEETKNAEVSLSDNKKRI